MKKKVLLSSIATIALCLCLIAGSTFALFTSGDEVNISVTAGQVKLTANVVDGSLKTWSLYETEKDARYDGLFANSGTAEFDTDKSLLIQRMTPGDVAKFTVHVENESNVNIRYRVRMMSEAVDAQTTNLTPALVTNAYIDGNIYPVTGRENVTAWRYIDANVVIEDIDITVTFPNTDDSISTDNRDNKYQNAAARMYFVIEAVQGNANPDTPGDDGFVVLTNDSVASLYNPSNKEMIFNGEGETVNLTDSKNGLWGSATVELADITTFANVKLDATGQKSEGSVFSDLDDGEDVTLILADNATVMAKNGDFGIWSAMGSNGESFTLMIDDSSSIAVSGDTAAVLVQGWEGTTANIVLNGSASQCLKLSNGATGFMFFGNDGQKIVANMYVNSDADMNAYSGLIQAEDAIVHWFVNGTYVKTVNY